MNLYRITLLFVTYISITINANAQCVNFTLSDQSDIDGFNSFCDEVGNIYIGNSQDITNLNGLSGITSITGTIQIYAENVTNLNGLHNITSIGGDLKLIGMVNLNSLQGLNSLQSIGGRLTIGSCNQLTNLEGIETLTTISDGLSISNNENLETLIGLHNVTSFNSMNLGGNDALTSLEGLTNLSTVTGNLIIANNNSLKNLSGMDNLESIDGDLSIDGNKSLACLCGLEGLTSIGNNITIEYNSAMMGLTGMENITSVGGNIELNGNAELYVCNLPNICTLISQGTNVIVSGNSTSYCNSLSVLQANCGIEICPDDFLLHYQSQVDHFIDNFPSCTDIVSDLNIDFTNIATASSIISNIEGLSLLNSVGGDITFDGVFVDPPLLNFNGFENLNYVGGNFTAYFLSNLNSTEFLGNLDSIGGYLRFEACNSLQNITGFSNLKKITNGLLITNNDLLNSIEGFEQVDSISSLYIDNNPNLISIQGIDNLNIFINGGTISNNTSLNYCAVFPVCNALNLGLGNFNFESNASGCNNEMEVMNACENTFSKAEGIVFLDLNCNASQDSNDILLENHLLKNVDGDLPLAFTDSLGNYSGILKKETTEIFYIDTLYGFSSNPQQITITTPFIPEIFINQNFNLCPTSNFHNLKVELSPYDPPRPGFDNEYQIVIENTGTNIENGTVVFSFLNTIANGNFTFIDIDGGMINGNTVEWDFNNLGVYQTMIFDLKINLEPTTELGTILYPEAEVFPQSGIVEDFLDDNTSTFEQEVVGSFDPNDKMVNIDSLDVENAAGVVLEYLIRFQNTGTFPATFVEVIDTIGASLDLSGFQMLAASHNYTLSFSEENILKWRFDDINLADSTSNEPESHGFIKFKIKTKSGLVLGTQIQNRAGIYFDFNEPVITNYALTDILQLNVEQINKNPINFEVYPNPTMDAFFIKYKLEESSDIQIQLLDINGKVIFNFQQRKLLPQEYIESINIGTQYNNGLYFLRIISNEKVYTKKIFLQKG